MKRIIISIAVFATIVGCIYDVFSNANGVAGQTTAPGEVTCSQSGCHGSGNGEGSSGGLADNTGGGSMTISGISGTYTPGTLYHLTVRVSQTGCGLFGFNFEPLDASGATVGTLTATQTGTRTTMGYYGSRAAITHGHNGASGPIAGTGADFFDLPFDWPAPANNMGPITFYAAGLAANGDALQTAGDNVYSATMTVNPSSALVSPLIMISRASYGNPSFYALANSVGNVLNFFVAGQSLTGNITANVTGTQFMISTSAGGPWVTSIPLTANTGVVNNTPIYIQYTGPSSGSQTGSVVISGGGAGSKTVTLNGQVRTPSFTVAPNPSSLNFNTVNVGSGPSATQTFTFTPANPVGGLVITCPPGYEASAVSNRDFNSILTPNFFGIGFPMTLYVRLKNPQVAGPINGNLTVALPGATTQNVALSATAVMPSKLVLASTNYLSLFQSSAGTPSASQTLTINGSGLTSNVVVSAPTNFEVSLQAASGYSSTVNIVPSGGTVVSTPVYVRYNSAFNELDYGIVTVASTGATTQNVNVDGVCFGVSAPSVLVTGVLNAFSATVGTPSSPQNFSVSGSNLTANLVITAPANFEVSLSSGSGFASSVNISPSGGSVVSTSVYTRYNPAAAGSHNGNVTVASSGVATQNLAVNGTATNAAPSVSVTGSLNTFSAIVGIPSSPQNFSVSGSNLTANLVITAPANFEVSLASGSGFASSVNISPSGGSVASTTIYTRYNPAAAGTHNGNVTIASSGVTTQNVVVSGTASNPVGINELRAAIVSLYPNPSNGIITIASEVLQNATVLVTDAIGKTVHSENWITSSLQIDLSANPTGVYYLSVISKNGAKTQHYKILINK